MEKKFIESSTKLENWIKHCALPLWLERGFCPHTGGHFERLDSDGLANLESSVRMRVQSRQLFVYAYAHHHEWCDQAESAASRLQEFIGKKRQGTVFPHLLDQHFQVIDARQDLYDYAFHIMAYAWNYRAFGKPEDLNLAIDLVHHIDAQFGSQSGGWLEGDYPVPYRRQNPHMHMLEAFIALFYATQEAYWLQRAEQIIELFEEHFFDHGHNMLLEYFEADWSVCQDSQQVYAEPGHMFEWVWLLHNFSHATGRDMSEFTDRLFTTACRFGFSAQGLLFDRITLGGQPLGDSMRLWPMTELIKASVVQARSGKSECTEFAALAIERLFENYLNVAVPGAYIDQRDSSDHILIAHAPASSLYHLVVAAGEASRWRNELIGAEQAPLTIAAFH